MRFQLWWDRIGAGNGETRVWLCQVGEDTLRAPKIVLEVPSETKYESGGPAAAWMEGDCQGYRYEGDVAHVY